MLSFGSILFYVGVVLCSESILRVHSLIHHESRYFVRSTLKLSTYYYECTEFSIENDEKLKKLISNPLSACCKSGLPLSSLAEKILSDFQIVVYPYGYRRRDLAIYLEYTGTSTVYCNFGLSLLLNNKIVRTLHKNGGAILGNSTEWRCGLTFTQTNISPDKGRARNWGASAWKAIDEESNDDNISVCGWLQFFQFPPHSLSKAGTLLSCGQVIVPIVKKSSFSTRKSKLFNNLDLRYGEEYRIMAVNQGETFFISSDTQTNITIRPSYHNRRGPWPVTYPLYNEEIDWLQLNNPRTLIPRITHFFQGNTKKSKSWLQLPLALFFWLLASIAPLPMVLTATTYVGGLYYIPTSSMIPTLQPGDLLIVGNFGLRKPQLHRGDIVVFKPPPQLSGFSPRQKFIKRIAFVQGDTVVDNKMVTNQNNLPSICSAPASALEQAAKDSQGITLPPDTVWLLGDCSSVSIDSRVWGPLPISYLVGIPTYRVWPLNRFGPL